MKRILLNFVVSILFGAVFLSICGSAYKQVRPLAKQDCDRQPLKVPVKNSFSEHRKSMHQVSCFFLER